MIEETENINVIKPIKEHLRIELYVGDAFQYRKTRDEEGKIKVIVIPEKRMLKRYFCTRIRSKLKSFLFANDCIRIEHRYSIYFIPNINVAKQFKEYIEGIKEVIESKELEELERAKKIGDEHEEKEIQKRINYLNKHWHKNKPSFEVIKAIPMAVE
jgi:hypothetical protein